MLADHRDELSSSSSSLILDSSVDLSAGILSAGDLAYEILDSVFYTELYLFYSIHFANFNPLWVGLEPCIS